MKKFIVNIFATTGISLLLLSITALFFHAQCIYLQTVFQVLGTNIMVHFGLFFLNKLEVKYAVFEIFLNITLILVMLLLFGSVFHWFTSTPLWVLMIMGFVIYIVSIILNLLCMQQEAQEINALIKKRNSKKNQ